MKFASRPMPSEALGFQMTPMLDVVFLLLCFILTSQIFSQWETEIDITLPTAATGEIPQRLPGEIIINIQADGETSVNQRVLNEEELGTLLRDIVNLWDKGQPVTIRADQAAAYEHVIRVLDACRVADIWNISFATGVPE